MDKLCDMDYVYNAHMNELVQGGRNSIANALWPLLLTWFNFNPSMDM